MRNRLLLLAVVGLFALGACSSTSPRGTAKKSIEWPGVRADGSVLLPNLWSLRPAGKQIAVGDFPVNIALHPAGRYAAILHCGYGEHEIIVIDVPSSRVLSRTSIEEAFYGIAFSIDGAKLFCSGSGNEVVHIFAFQDGHLSGHETIQLREAREKGIPAGVAPSSDGRRLYVANVWAHRVSQVDLVGKTNLSEFLLGTNTAVLTAKGANAPVDLDLAATTKRAEALLASTDASEPFPYACVLDERQNRLYVSLWAQAAVAVIDLNSGKVESRWPAEEHPNEMLLTRSGKFLFVANANRNTVTVFDTDTGLKRETLYAALQPNALPGATPNSLALSPDETILFVANANVNAVAVFDVSDLGRSRSLGFIPVGWYPTSVRVSLDGKRLLVANGKGMISKSNPLGPRPGQELPATLRQYIGALLQGTLSIIELPEREKLEEQLKQYTAQVYRCSPSQTDPAIAASRLKDNPIPFDEPAPANPPLTPPRRGTRHHASLPFSGGAGGGFVALMRGKTAKAALQAGGPSPIKYCIYVIKENRTYDQVLGDMPEGNGDPSLCLFPERVTPNHHKLAREFVLLDNFYVEGEVSADGHEWSMGAYATDFVEKSWPLGYRPNPHKKHVYPAEGRFKIAEPAGGYLWDRAREAGISYRSYGEFINNAPTTNEPGTTRMASLQGHFDPWFRSFDMDYSDLLRADRFIQELNRFEREGEMPRLQIVRLPNDHTAGALTGKLTPTAFVAENDLAFGRMIEAVSQSKFWPQTAIFVVEDDAQNGPDHVDAHRTIAYVISPYARRNSVDSTMYSTSSMLRTMELILGLKPMSQFDAAATPMFSSFQAKADLRPYKAMPANVDLQERNKATAWGKQLSEAMDFSQEDAADDLLLNEVVWRSVRGENSPMPAPTRAAFVFVHSEEDEDDE